MPSFSKDEIPPVFLMHSKEEEPEVKIVQAHYREEFINQDFAHKNEESYFQNPQISRNQIEDEEEDLDKSIEAEELEHE